MKLVIISDTHNQHHYIPSIPDGDVLIHCGDFTNRGEQRVMREFLDWFANQPHQYKVFIAGNHELSLDNASRKSSLKIIEEFTSKHNNLFFLENSSVEIEGLKFYGSPITPFFSNWAFNFQRGKDIAAEWAKIPDDVNVLITHGPAYGILDMVENNIFNMGRDLHQGCKDLADRIKDLKKLKVHCGGHLHTDGGKQLTLNNVIHVNAAICTERYQPTNPPVEIEI